MAAVVSALPFWVLYLMSDLLSFILKYVVRYRKKVVIRNLQRSFPDKSLQERKKVLSSYYKNLADVTLEVIKLARITPHQLKRRFKFKNYELLHNSFSTGKSVIIATGHCGNWEWMGTALGLLTPQKGFALTKPLTDKNFNAHMEKLRHRLNPDSTIPFKSAFREMVRRKDIPSFYVIAADQTPTLDEANYWTRFLNQDTPFFLGIEKIARGLNTDVIFMDVHRTGRGKYCGEMQLISNSSVNTQDGEITEKYVQLLEKAIRKNPSNWLWSHRRWKHKRPFAED
jgi:KDO2-lipid IV(A) lauroyltransferase